jgi:protocatechuate 3,4-dioxygenase beta subunit
MSLAGKPLNHATITMFGNGWTDTSPMPPSYRTTSNVDGLFSIQDVEPNAYRIFVDRAGYLSFVYTQANGAVSHPISEGEHMKIEVKLTAQSAIAGRVTDEDGEPFPNARVTLFRMGHTGGKRQLGALTSVAAGADGVFSIGSVRAGHYYLAASTPPSLGDTNHRLAPGDERYVTTYHPSATDAASATLIDVAAETELHGLDIRIRRARVFHVAGKVVQASGGAADNATLALIRPGMTDLNDPMANANRIIAGNGVFQINGLLPGTYALQGWAGRGRELQGHQTVVIADRDVDDVAVTLVPGLEIPLTVRIEDADQEQSQKIASVLGPFTLTATDGVNLNSMAGSKDEGTWVFHNIGRGTYRMGLGGPDGTYVKSIRFGAKDVTRSELDTTSGGGALVMVLSPHPAEVAGVVSDGDGKALAGVTVSLWAPGVPAAGTLDQTRLARTDADGKFRFGNLAPGEYRVAAWEQIEPGLAMLPEFHQRFDAQATVVKVAEDAHETVRPVVIGKKQVEEVAAAVQW